MSITGPLTGLQHRHRIAPFAYASSVGISSELGPRRCHGKRQQGHNSHRACTRPTSLSGPSANPCAIHSTRRPLGDRARSSMDRSADPTLWVGGFPDQIGHSAACLARIHARIGPFPGCGDIRAHQLLHVLRHRVSEITSISCKAIPALVCALSVLLAGCGRAFLRGPRQTSHMQVIASHSIEEASRPDELTYLASSTLGTIYKSSSIPPRSLSVHGPDPAFCSYLVLYASPPQLTIGHISDHSGQALITK